MHEPCAANGWQAEHAGLLLRCHRHWTGRDLIDPGLPPQEAARALYHAPFVVLAHDTAADPRFSYANLSAQRLFEMPWAEIVGLPSRYSAEPMLRAERERLLERVRDHGFIDDYSGIRIARSGLRFSIGAATVWNLFDEQGNPAGQAASFGDWQYLA
ncbi:MEKHLA domain-containing protein [Sulfuritortus calidifontis]|uniref:MEKHLA domain-containing protein n=1 Tax=Sulfuritortus calidifontis TaxID=1914471 RepID=A0A4R3JTK6_9PROT|nr:MEKHLA domain-containing protein [Sulfuritortus calidifontis]TCS69015.1 MEKHLA domain-containing protein [Sulfuritortus calidifontis]